MKRYDPAYRTSEPLVRGLHLQAIEITVIDPSEANQIGHHDIRRFPGVRPAARALRARPGPANSRGDRGLHAARRPVFAENCWSCSLSTTSTSCGALRRPGRGARSRTCGPAGRARRTVRPQSGCSLRPTIALHYLPDLANYQETVAYYAKADRVRLASCVAVLPEHADRDRRGVDGRMRPGALQKRGHLHLRKPFKEETPALRRVCATVPVLDDDAEEARGDVALLHKIFHGISARWSDEPQVAAGCHRPRVRPIRAATSTCPIKTEGEGSPVRLRAAAAPRRHRRGRGGDPTGAGPAGWARSGSRALGTP